MKRLLIKIAMFVVIGIIVSINNVRKVEERQRDAGYEQTNFNVTEETKEKLETNKQQIEKIINDEKNR